MILIKVNIGNFLLFDDDIGFSPLCPPHSSDHNSLQVADLWYDMIEQE